jgi:ankyrin repeat protein
VSLQAAGDTRLIDAARKADKVALRALVKQKVDVNTRAGDGSTALHWAAHWDDVEAADLLIAAGADVNALDDLGGSPLWVASSDAGAAMVARLLKAGANPNLAPLSGATPLMMAAHVGNVDSVKALLIRGANVNAAESGRGQTALMWAAAERHAGVVSALVEAGADINARSSARPLMVTTGPDYDSSFVVQIQLGGYTPLMFAAQQGDIESARALIAAGAKVNDVDAGGISALVLAAHSGQEAFAMFLAEQGADPNLAGAGYTAIHAAILLREERLVKALLARGADPNAPLQKATPVRRGSIDNALSPQMVGASPLWLAARFAEPDALRALAAAGADPHFAMKDGATVLMAPLTGRAIDPDNDGAGRTTITEQMIVETMTAALELGVDVNAANSAGATTLHLAVPRGNKSVVELLASKGANMNMKDKKGRTPLDVALGSKTGGEMAELLRKLGATE